MNIKHIANEQIFAAEIKNTLPTVVLFGNPGCSACTAAERVLTRFPGKNTLIKVDVDIAPNLAYQAGVTIIPTIIIYIDGKEDDRVTGVTGKTYKDWQELLSVWR
jgi:thioredoxin-like negative regulator of GroEL